MKSKYDKKFSDKQLNGADSINKVFKDCFEKRLWGGRWKIRSAMSLYTSLLEHRIISEGQLLDGFALLLLRSQKIENIKMFLDPRSMTDLLGIDPYNEWEASIKGFKALLDWKKVNIIREGYEPKRKYKIAKDHLFFAAQSVLEYAKDKPGRNKLLQFFQGALIPHHISPELYDHLDSFCRVCDVLGNNEPEKILEYYKEK